MNLSNTGSRFSKLLFGSLLLTFFIGCSSDNDFAAPTETILEIVSSSDEFSTLEEAVIAAGLDGTLSSDNYTLFAPTNDAFAQLLADLDLTKEELLADVELLTTVLTYHVITGTVVANEAIAIANSDNPRVVTVNGDEFVISQSDALYLNTSAVTDTNKLAKNGIVHELNKVLLPPAPDETNKDANVFDAITALAVASEPEFTILLAAVESEPQVKSALSSGGPLTLFAPTDLAFANLLNELGITEAELLARDDLDSILLQHALLKEIQSLDAYAANGSRETTANTAKELPITITNGALTVGGSNVVQTDIIASTGVIHKIDKVITDGAIDKE